MRIISGKLKGKKILLPKDINTRPLRDLVKESIFNLINHSTKINFQIENSKVLDLFSGTGSFGIECISRGANNVTFVENYNDALKILKENISILGLDKKSKIIEKNCFEFMDSNNDLNNKYDLIFMDPPYKEKNINNIINTIKEKKTLNNDGIMIIHRHKKDDIKISQHLKILDERNYGISKIILGN